MLVRRILQRIELILIQSKRNAVTINGRLIPTSIKLPNYATTGIESTSLVNPKINSSDIIESAKDGGKVLSSIYSRIDSFLHADMTTKDIDDFVYETCLSLDVYPSPLNYMGFPASCCTSLNNVAVHGIPSASCYLKKGDLLSIDIAIFYDGLVHIDSCRSYLIDDPNFTCIDSIHLMDVAKECLEAGVSVCGPGVKFKEIGQAIQKVADTHHINVFTAVLGHGIGTHLHEPPDIRHHSNSNKSSYCEMTMEPGMMFTVEPCVGFSNVPLLLGSDNWTFISSDGLRCCQFEHTVCITENGVDILTE